MPDRDESTPASIPQLDPALWEDHEGFRETFLLYFPNPKENETLRSLGELLFSRALEAHDQGQPREESPTRSELRAALAELRFIEGYLGSLGEEHVVSSLGSEDAVLSRFAAGEALEVGRVAERIERELGV